MATSADYYEDSLSSRREKRYLYRSHKCSKACHQNKFDGIIYHADIDRHIAYELKCYLENEITIACEDKQKSHRLKLELMGNILSAPYFGAISESSKITKTIILVYTKKFEKDSQTKEGANAIMSLVPYTGLEIVTILYDFGDNEKPDLLIARNCNYLRYEPKTPWFKEGIKARLGKNLFTRLQHDMYRGNCESKRQNKRHQTTYVCQERETVQSHLVMENETSVLQNGSTDTEESSVGGMNGNEVNVSSELFGNDVSSESEFTQRIPRESTEQLIDFVAGANRHGNGHMKTTIAGKGTSHQQMSKVKQDLTQVKSGSRDYPTYYERSEFDAYPEIKSVRDRHLHPERNALARKTSQLERSCVESNLKITEETLTKLTLTTGASSALVECEHVSEGTMPDYHSLSRTLAVNDYSFYGDPLTGESHTDLGKLRIMNGSTFSGFNSMFSEDEDMSSYSSINDSKSKYVRGRNPTAFIQENNSMNVHLAHERLEVDACPMQYSDTKDSHFHTTSDTPNILTSVTGKEGKLRKSTTVFSQIKRFFKTKRDKYKYISGIPPTVTGKQTERKRTNSLYQSLHSGRPLPPFPTRTQISEARPHYQICVPPLSEPVCLCSSSPVPTSSEPDYLCSWLDVSQHSSPKPNFPGSCSIVPQSPPSYSHVPQPSPSKQNDPSLCSREPHPSSSKQPPSHSCPHVPQASPSQQIPPLLCSPVSQPSPSQQTPPSFCSPVPQPSPSQQTSPPFCSPVPQPSPSQQTPPPFCSPVLQSSPSQQNHPLSCSPVPASSEEHGSSLPGSSVSSISEPRLPAPLLIRHLPSELPKYSLCTPLHVHSTSELRPPDPPPPPACKQNIFPLFIQLHSPSHPLVPLPRTYNRTEEQMTEEEIHI